MIRLPVLCLLTLTACDLSDGDQFRFAGDDVRGLVVTVGEFKSPPQSVYAPVLNGVSTQNFEGRVRFREVGGDFVHVSRRVDVGPNTISAFNDQFTIPPDVVARAIPRTVKNYFTGEEGRSTPTIALRVELYDEDEDPPGSDDWFTGAHDIVATGIEYLPASGWDGYRSVAIQDRGMRYVTHATTSTLTVADGQPNGSYVIFHVRPE